MHGARVVPPIARLLLCMDDHVGKALGLAYKFYTAVATILHCWRDQVRAVYTAWSRMFPDAMPKFQAPPKPIQQRWGRAVDCAKFLLNLDRRSFIAVFTGVLTGTSYYKDYTPDDGDAVGEDDDEPGGGEAVEGGGVDVPLGRAKAKPKGNGRGGRGRGRGRGGGE